MAYDDFLFVGPPEICVKSLLREIDVLFLVSLQHFLEHVNGVHFVVCGEEVYLRGLSIAVCFIVSKFKVNGARAAVIGTLFAPMRPNIEHLPYLARNLYLLAPVVFQVVLLRGIALKAHRIVRLRKAVLGSLKLKHSAYQLALCTACHPLSANRFTGSRDLAETKQAQFAALRASKPRQSIGSSLAL